MSLDFYGYPCIDLLWILDQAILLVIYSLLLEIVNFDLSFSS